MNNLNNIPNKPISIPNKPISKPTKPISSPDVLAPYLAYASKKKRYDSGVCDKIANDIFGNAKMVKKLDEQTFFVNYMLKVAGVDEKSALSEYNEHRAFFKDTFKMLGGNKRSGITKDIFIKKLKRDGICNRNINRKSRYEIEGDSSCAVNNKEKVIKFLFILLVILALFYLFKKR